MNTSVGQNYCHIPTHPLRLPWVTTSPEGGIKKNNILYASSSNTLHAHSAELRMFRYPSKKGNAISPLLPPAHNIHCNDQGVGRRVHWAQPTAGVSGALGARDPRWDRRRGLSYLTYFFPTPHTSSLVGSPPLPWLGGRPPQEG